LEGVRKAIETPLRVAVIRIKMKYRSSRLRVQEDGNSRSLENAGVIHCVLTQKVMLIFVN
jgi:hypothetical protein